MSAVYPVIRRTRVRRFLFVPLYKKTGGRETHSARKYALTVPQIEILSYNLVAASKATKRIFSLKSVGIFPKMRLSQSESAKQSAAYKN